MNVVAVCVIFFEGETGRTASGGEESAVDLFMFYSLCKGFILKDTCYVWYNISIFRHVSHSVGNTAIY